MIRHASNQTVATRAPKPKTDRPDEDDVRQGFVHQAPISRRWCVGRNKRQEATPPGECEAQLHYVGRAIQASRHAAPLNSAGRQHLESGGRFPASRYPHRMLGQSIAV
jgi:hypothetical protein